MIQSILLEYDLRGNDIGVQPFGNGLIHKTWKIEHAGNEYILQRINDDIFRNPAAIASNISLISRYLKNCHPHYHFVSPMCTVAGAEMVYKEGMGYFRMFPFVSGSHSKDVVQNPEQAFEAAVQFGRFTRSLSGINIDELNITIPDFHNLDLRYTQFLQAISTGNKVRVESAAALVQCLMDEKNIVDEFNGIIQNKAFKLRVTHHDTKISNILFDEAEKGICVIDLDTVMPGYIFSDIGDMMRTYLSPVSEEERDFSKIMIRKDIYAAIVKGYYSELKNELSDEEKQSFFFSGKFMIYMQALRFLTDYLNDDLYYGATYPEQNVVRAGNQYVLLQMLLEQEAELTVVL